MSKKYIFITIFIFIISIITLVLLVRSTSSGKTIWPNTEGSNSSSTENEAENKQGENGNYDSLDLPTEGNNTILTTDSSTILRVVNEYDKNFFTAKKNLLIMFASWCPNCQEEISEIEKILEHYKNIKDVNVVLIAHEYDNTVTDLIDLLENDVDFGDVEVKIDLGRVIRKEIDPEASTIPISYVVDKNGKVLEVHNESLTLEKAIDMVGK